MCYRSVLVEACGAAGAVQSAELDQKLLPELKQKAEKVKEACRAAEDKVEVRMESVADEIREQLKVVQLMLASGGSSNLASSTSRVQGLEANYHWGMVKIDSQVAQLEHEIKVAKSEAGKTTEQADGASRRELTSQTGEASRQGTEERRAGEHSARSVPERFPQLLARFASLQMQQASIPCCMSMRPIPRICQGSPLPTSEKDG